MRATPNGLEDDDDELDERELLRKQREAERKAFEEMQALLAKIRDHLYQYYQPALSPKNSEFHFTTKEVRQQLLQVFPNQLVVTDELVATWLSAGGFQMYDFGNMRFEWLFNRKE